MPDHIELRRRLYYAVLTVPKDLQDKFGKRHVKSTGTSDRIKAKATAAVLVGQWKLEFEEVRGTSNPTLRKALEYRREYEKARSDEERDIYSLIISEEAESIFDTTASHDKATLFSDLAHGSKTLSEPYFKQWKDQLSVTPRTVEQYSKDALLFIQKFPLIEDVSKSLVSKWLDSLGHNGTTKDSQKRIVKGCRSFWRYVLRYDIKGAVEDPFFKVITHDKGKKKPSREIFEPQEILELWQLAKNRADSTLADLIALGAYTGARIEELCSIKVNEVNNEFIKINDSKTPAGIRSIPIHFNLRSLIKRLKDSSKDGYLLSGLTFDRYKDRSGAMSKRFGILKTKAGHGRSKVFHCLRHTLITNLINLGVSELVAQDIVGHEKKGVTGGVYLKGINHDVKLEALNKISYPFPDLT